MLIINQLNLASYEDGNNEIKTAILDVTPEIVDYNIKKTQILCAARNWVESIESNPMATEVECQLAEQIKSLTHPED